jgi:hypothetical protein
MKIHAKKQTIDHRVALEVGLPIETVALITQSFLDHFKNVLIEYGDVQFKDFIGVSVRREGPPKYLLLRSSRKMREAIRLNKKETGHGQVRSGRDADA